MRFARRSAKNHSHRERGNPIQRQRKEDPEATDHLLESPAAGFKPPLSADPVPGASRESRARGVTRTYADTGNSWASPSPCDLGGSDAVAGPTLHAFIDQRLEIYRDPHHTAGIDALQCARVGEDVICHFECFGVFSSSSSVWVCGEVVVNLERFG